MRFVGVIEVRKPPARRGLLRPPIAPPFPMPFVGESWLPFAGVPGEVLSEGVDPETTVYN